MKCKSSKNEQKTKTIRSYKTKGYNHYQFQQINVNWFQIKDKMNPKKSMLLNPPF